MRRLKPSEWQTLILSAYLVLGAFIWRQFGLGWDEEFQNLCGKTAIQWYLGISATSPLEVFNCWFYGALFEYIAAIPVWLFNMGDFEARGLMCFFVSFVGVIYTGRLARLLGGGAAGPLAVLLLILTPVYFGHSFHNTKDMPFASFYLVGLYYLVRVYQTFPRSDAKLLVKAGVLLGAALGVRVAGVFLVGLYGLMWLEWAVRKWRHNLLDRSSLKRALVSASVIYVLGWAFMVLWWPFAQKSPFLNPAKALIVATQFPWPGSVLFEGNFVRANELPFRYIPVWLWISLPEFYFLAALTFLVLVFRRLRHSVGKWRVSENDRLFFLVAASVLLPLFSVWWKRPVIYDGIRHFLFLLPPTAALAASSLVFGWQKLSNRFGRLTFQLVLGALFLRTAFDMICLHPYESIYFNRLGGGGQRAASERFETDYWGNSYAEGVRWLTKNYQPVTPEKITVANTSAEFLTGYFIKSDPVSTKHFVSVGNTAAADIVLTTTRWNNHKNIKGKVLHVVERVGVPILYIFEVKGGKGRVGVH